MSKISAPMFFPFCNPPPYFVDKFNPPPQITLPLPSQKEVLSTLLKGQVITINPQFGGLYRGEHRNLRDFIRKTRLFKGKELTKCSKVNYFPLKSLIFLMKPTNFCVLL